MVAKVATALLGLRGIMDGIQVLTARLEEEKDLEYY